MDKISGQLEEAALLDVDEVAPYLVARGHVPTATGLNVERLGGGVSNAVFAVRGPRCHLVLKQALPRLQVADLWEADPGRVIREALALQTLHELTPDHVPACLDADEDRHVLVVPHAPAGWTDWKARLLAGDADSAIAASLGEILATWHVSTIDGVPERLHDKTSFGELRVDPYYRTTMTRRPDLAPAIGGHLEQMLKHEQCLVHGDFSPKNVLCGDSGLWLIDLEVAHVGDPAFDLAFLLSHLTLKAVRRPALSPAYGSCATAFADRYQARAGAATPSWEHVLGHVGCLLVARVIGKSPVEYLDPPQQEVACALGADLLTRPPNHVDRLWDRLEEVLR